MHQAADYNQIYVTFIWTFFFFSPITVCHVIIVAVTFYAVLDFFYITTLSEPQSLPNLCWFMAT